MGQFPDQACRGSIRIGFGMVAAENARQIKSFLERRSDATAMPVAADWGLPAGTGRQILPGEAGMDGFFYCRLIKSA